MFILGSIPIPTHPWSSDAAIAFHIGSLPIRWYGIFITIGFILAIILAVVKLECWYKVKSDPFYWYCLMGIPAAILGARFWSCCLGDAEWSQFFIFSTGGLAIEGGVVFAALVALWWFPFILKKPKYQVRDLTIDPTKPQIRQVSIWVYVDGIIPCILIGQVIGRWGNYFNQEIYGQLINSSHSSYIEWLCYHLPYMYVSDSSMITGYYQPLFLYESCTNLVGLIILYIGFEFIPKLKSGTIGMCYFLWYGIVRLVFEPLRYNQYSFVNTYVMTGIWITFSIILIVLNQIGIIPKTRNYRCKLYMNDKLLKPIQTKFNAFNIKKINKKIDKFIVKNPNYLTNEQIKKQYQNLIQKQEYYLDQKNQIINKYKVHQTLYKRSFADKLYYLGR